MFSSEAFVFPLFGKVRFWESIVSWDRATTFAVCTRALAHSPYVWYVWYVCARVCVCVCVRVCTCVCVCARAMCACAHGENIGATNGNQQSPDALNERSGAGNLCGRHNMALHAPLHRGRGRIYKPQGGHGQCHGTVPHQWRNGASVETMSLSKRHGSRNTRWRSRNIWPLI